MLGVSYVRIGTTHYEKKKNVTVQAVRCCTRLSREVTASFPGGIHHLTGHDLEQADVTELAFCRARQDNCWGSLPANTGL